MHEAHTCGFKFKWAQAYTEAFVRLLGSYLSSSLILQKRVKIFIYI